MIKGKFVVIDDIERKHEKLSIDEVLGFIDDCVQNLGCRILLVLNSDKLKDGDLWAQFREKVIDQELRLDTTPAEAFDIAVVKTPTPYAANIKEAVEACGINNIRIVRKIIRVVNRLLSKRSDLSPSVLSRTIPSTALLSAVYYKGIDGGPTIDFVLNFDTYLIAKYARDANKKQPDPTEDDKAREKWLLLIDALGIKGTDDFERLVADCLTSGMVDTTEVERIIERYTTEERNLVFRSRVDTFLDHSIWHPELSDDDLVRELDGLLPDIELVDPPTATSLSEAAKSLPDGEARARRIIGDWVSTFRRLHPPGGDEEATLDLDRNVSHRPVHPDIQAEFEALRGRALARTTILDVCRKVKVEHGWGARETSFMESVTGQQYEAAIRAVTGGELRLILFQSIDFLKNKQGWPLPFGVAADRFLEACRSIEQDAGSVKLRRIIRMVFQGAKREDELDAIPVGDEAEAAQKDAGAAAHEAELEPAQQAAHTT